MSFIHVIFSMFYYFLIKFIIIAISFVIKWVVKHLTSTFCNNKENNKKQNKDKRIIIIIGKIWKLKRYRSYHLKFDANKLHTLLENVKV